MMTPVFVKDERLQREKRHEIGYLHLQSVW